MNTSLPNEVIEHIFGFIREKRSFVPVLCTCKLWNEIAKKFVDPSMKGQRAIGWACKNGKLECVRYLLKDGRVDPSYDFNWAIRLASEFGHLEIVQELLNDERIDPSDRSNYAIRHAID